MYCLAAQHTRGAGGSLNQYAIRLQSLSLLYWNIVWTGGNEIESLPTNYLNFKIFRFQHSFSSSPLSLTDSSRRQKNSERNLWNLGESEPHSNQIPKRTITEGVACWWRWWWTRRLTRSWAARWMRTRSWIPIKFLVGQSLTIAGFRQSVVFLYYWQALLSPFQGRDETST